MLGFDTLLVLYGYLMLIILLVFVSYELFMRNLNRGAYLEIKSFFPSEHPPSDEQRKTDDQLKADARIKKLFPVKRPPSDDQLKTDARKARLEFLDELREIPVPLNKNFHLHYEHLKIENFLLRLKIRLDEITQKSDSRK